MDNIYFDGYVIVDSVDITDKISEFVLSLEDTDTKIKLLRSIEFIQNKEFKLFYKTNYNYSPCIYLVNETRKVIGRFEISQLYPTGTKDMSISVEDEFQGNGISRLLIASLIYILIKTPEYRSALTPDIILYIDTDASSGFWNSIGMRENDITPYNGYEKIIELSNLSKYAIGYDIFGSTSTELIESPKPIKTKTTKTNPTKTNETKNKTTKTQRHVKHTNAHKKNTNKPKKSKKGKKSKGGSKTKKNKIKKI
jgi:hypothetical protein